MTNADAIDIRDSRGNPVGDHIREDRIRNHFIKALKAYEPVPDARSETLQCFIRAARDMVGQIDPNRVIDMDPSRLWAVKAVCFGIKLLAEIIGRCPGNSHSSDLLILEQELVKRWPKGLSGTYGWTFMGLGFHPEDDVRAAHLVLGE
jgi:hypothetical protein